MSDTAIKLHETLVKYGRPATFPVGVKLVKKGDQAPEKIRYLGKRGAYRYPVPNLSAMSEPNIPENYFRIDPKGSSSA